MSATGYIGLGGNLGDRERNLLAGLAGMARAGFPAEALSSVWETEPVGPAGPRWFLNLVARVSTPLEPERLLDLLLEIERGAGRVRGAASAARTLDLDLLLLGDHRLEGPRLVLPHPRMWERRFVLAPLAELAPDLRNPRSGRTVVEELSRLDDPHRVREVGKLALPRSLFV